MPTAQQQREKLIRLLKELFQLDQPDLDFGFYRIMHAKSAQVSAFLDKDLLAIVEDAFGKDSGAKRVELEQAYQCALQQAKEFGAPDPQKAPAVLKAKAALDAAGDTASSEADVYDHLYRFFERYYDGGDFLSRRYLSAETGSKAAAFAVPYDGREVYLHWANADQYYIKTSEYFANFTFDPTQANQVQAAKGTLFDGKDAPALKVHFQVVEAAEGEHGNVKATEQQKRFFILKSDQPAYFENGELVLSFEFRPDPDKSGQEGTWQAKRNEQAVERALTALDELARGRGDADALLDGRPVAELARQYAAVLRTPAPTDKQPNRPILARYVVQYTARNTMDYFIHKNLGGFLRRELDFYIKNEVMRLDDIEAADAPAVETYLGKVRVLRAIAHKLIDFLAQLENFQKKLWLKKKFVVETNWCITLDRIIAIEDAKLRESLLAEIAANDAQREEWVRLFAIDEIKKDLHNPGFSDPLKIDFLNANQFLVLDTAFFDPCFTARIISAIHGLDEQCSGLLVHSESSQAMALLRTLLAKTIDLIFIDPPYNTGVDGFIYKDVYQHSSWLSMLRELLCLAAKHLHPRGLFFATIDYVEVSRLRLLCDSVFGDANFLADIAWEKRYTRSNNANRFYSLKDTVLCYRASDSLQEVKERRTDKSKENYTNPDNDPRGSWISSSYVNPATKAERPNLVYSIKNPVTGKKVEHPTHAWKYDANTHKEHIAERRLYWGLSGEYEYPRLKTFLSEAGEGMVPVDVWGYKDTGTTDDGGKTLKELFGEAVFDNPKPTTLVERTAKLLAPSALGPTIMDFFAGSGTTAHAAMNLRREDGITRKYVLVEMGEHFDSVIRPRICKVAYAKDWSNGKPISRETGISQMFKYIRLENYEDALNNLAFADNAERDNALAANAGLRQEYVLRYILDVETAGSQSLLNIDGFADPTAYKLKVKKPGSDEYVWKNVDLIETFNYLLGLRVEHMAAPQTFAAKFKREKDPELPKNTNTRLVLDGKLKQDAKGPWWFRRVEGWVPTGSNGGREKVLVIWRRLTGNIEQDNLALDEYFEAHRISTKDWEFDTIYVNGSNNLPNLKHDDDTWKVRLIEEDFQRLMWEVDDV